MTGDKGNINFHPAAMEENGRKGGGTAHLPASLSVINPGANEVQPDSFLLLMESSQGAPLANEDITG